MLLIGCGILQKEIRHLIAKNGWKVTPYFLPSGLHTDFGKLRRALDGSLAAHAGRSRVVFYGACHPLMDRILADGHTVRTPGQNCVDICLGQEVFARELANGAFFLFEDWALHWDRIVGGRQGLPPAVMREIFRDAHTHLLAIRTPCSGDFSAEAEEISQRTSLDLRWMDTGLEHLERTLAATIRGAKGELP
ncbi:MAG TPA: DUF1638 domain-containing protein [Vicinamibacterales bacterium]